MSIRVIPAVDISGVSVRADDVKCRLLARAEAVCRHLLPAGKRVRNDWICGGVDGRPGRSLSVNLAKGVWKDFATGDAGSNLLELWRQVRRTDFVTALTEAARFCGQTLPQPVRNRDVVGKTLQRGTWPTFEVGTRQDLIALANRRGIAVEGIELARERGLLRFAVRYGHRCWIVTDSRRLNAQARRLDGQPFIVDGKPAKALTLPGSQAGTPIGLIETKRFPAVAVVEGGPDLLAAHGCMWAEGRSDVAAVAMLGAGHRPLSAAWAALYGKQVKIYFHRDAEGEDAGIAWGGEIRMAGATKVEGFRFDGLRKVDCSPVNDLNDLLALHPDDFESHRDTWEILP
jgi:hypothetical protein